MQGVIPCEHAQLRYVHAYKHMGSNITISVQPAHEVSCRMAAMQAEARRLRKPVMRNPSVARQRELSTVQSHLVSKGFFHAGTWPSLCSQIYKRVRHGVLNIYRDMLGCRHDDISTLFDDDAVIAELGVMSPLTMIRINRLLLFMQVLQKAPPLLIRILLAASPAKDAWINAVHADLRWLAMGSIIRSDF
jgi:hypothetical protein